jgi:DNA-binding LacI/PurR family transcriptional regulator
MNIREVAKKAGVSTATVSRVVNGTVPVSALIERQVRSAIKSLGYYPNTHARTLGSGRSHMYGLIISDIANPFFPDIVKFFERIAVEHGQEVLIANTDYQPHRMEVCVRRMLERRVDGVAIMTSEMDSKLVQLLNKRGIPVVLLDTGHVGPHISNVFIDYANGIEQAIEHLISFRHKRIAFVSGPPNLASAKTRSNAFALSLERKGLSLSADYMQIGNHRIDGGQSAMAKLLKLRQPPTAVMASNDLTAIGMMREIHAAGLNVPRDISVLGFDDIEISNFLQPTLTTIRVPRAEIGVNAFNALYFANHRRGNGGTEYRISTELVIRDSTGLVSPHSRRPSEISGRRVRS